jgi:glycosyltransferase involved in cell wall biosynthesis
MRNKLVLLNDHAGKATPVAPPPETSPLLVCFSHLRWNFVFQRPQQLLTRAAENYRVLYFEEPIFEEGVTPRLEITTPFERVEVATPVLPTGIEQVALDAELRSQLDVLLAARVGATLVTWYYTPMALAFSAHLEEDVCVYDCMDELTGFKNPPPRLAEFENDLFARADVVFTGGRSLFEAKRGRHPRVHAFPSSIDAAHFGKARRSLPDPDDQAWLPKPRIGFFGVIDERMDLDLVDETARLRPDLHFVMLGPVVKIDPASLPRRPNIHWLGGKSYAELPAYLAHWQAGWMPFAMNEATRFISPTKTPEFLAAGVPLVSTPIADVVRPYGALGLVEIARDSASAAEKLDLIIARPRDAWLEAVDNHLADNSWDRTWAAMKGHLDHMGALKSSASLTQGAVNV